MLATPFPATHEISGHERWYRERSRKTYSEQQLEKLTGAHEAIPLGRAQRA
jgi:hypothetical protein